MVESGRLSLRKDSSILMGMNRRELFALAAGAVAAPSIPAIPHGATSFSVLTEKGLYVGQWPEPPYGHDPEIMKLVRAGKVQWGGVSLREIEPGVLEMNQGGKRTLALNPLGSGNNWISALSRGPRLQSS